MIRVVLGEDSFIVREGLREMLATRRGVEVVAVCGDLDELLAAVGEHEPDVVMTDIRMPPTNTDEGIRAAAALRESHPELGVVVLSQYSDPGYVLALLESGSDGRAYLLKERVHDLQELTGRAPGGGLGRIGDRPEDRRRARRGQGAARRRRAGRAQLTGARGARRDRAGKEQRRDRRLPAALEARGREAHSRDLHQARPGGLRGGQQAGQGRPAVPRGRGPAETPRR